MESVLKVDIKSNDIAKNWDDISITEPKGPIWRNKLTHLEASINQINEITSVTKLKECMIT